MEYAVIAVVAFGASLLAFYSGFGLGTLLTPAFVIFFPVELAVGLAAVVHFLNNLFKLTLVGRFADRSVLFRFGIPAIVAAFLGAEVLIWLSRSPPLFSYSAAGHHLEVLPIKLLIAVVMGGFALLEVSLRFRKISFERSHLLLGGILSGFFGGLSGHQGAFRSAFLAKTGMSRDAFIGTGVVIACMIDAARLLVYSGQISKTNFSEHVALLAIATLAACFGAFLGNRLLKRVTMAAIQRIVTVALLAVALGIASGLI